MRLIIMFIAIALSAGAFFITMHFTSNNKDQAQPTQPAIVQSTPQPQEEPGVDIYTAKQDISIGTVITQDMLDLQSWPKSKLLADMVTVDQSHPSAALNMITRTPFQKGEPIIMNRLANPNDPSFLASSLDKGMRMITIAVDVVSGGGGFVFPGDRVDVLITHDVATGQMDEKKQPIKDPVTEVLVSDVRIMATNQKSTAHGGDAPVVPTNVSLEVSADNAQKIRLAESANGRLSIALRALKDKDTATIARPTGISDLSAVRTVPSAENDEVTVVRGVDAVSVGVKGQ